MLKLMGKKIITTFLNWAYVQLNDIRIVCAIVQADLGYCNSIYTLFYLHIMAFIFLYLFIVICLCPVYDVIFCLSY